MVSCRQRRVTPTNRQKQYNNSKTYCDNPLLHCRPIQTANNVLSPLALVYPSSYNFNEHKRPAELHYMLQTLNWQITRELETLRRILCCKWRGSTGSFVFAICWWCWAPFGHNVQCCLNTVSNTIRRAIFYCSCSQTFSKNSKYCTRHDRAPT